MEKDIRFTELAVSKTPDVALVELRVFSKNREESVIILAAKSLSSP